MKTNIIFAGLMICSTSLFAQAEHDDMYFKKKDRAKLNQQKEKSAQEEHTQAIARGEKQLRFDYPIKTNQVLPAQSNQTNPEYIARSQSEVVAEEQSYFLENYQYGSQIDNNTTFGNNTGLWAGSPVFYNGYYLPQVNGWNRSYYSAFDDPFFMGFNRSPWICNGFINANGLRFNYGWDYHWGYGFGNRFYQWSIMWGNNAQFWGSPYYGNGFYNNNFIIVDNGNNGAVYGKRSSRGQNTADASVNNAQRSTRVASYTRDNSTGVNSGGANVRQSSRSAQAEYYTPQWRRVTQQTGGTSTYSAPENRMKSGNSSYDNNNATQRSSYSAPTQRSSSPSPSYSAPTRSSSGSSSGGGSGSPSRSSRGGN
jgi:hypothetical protein